MDRLTELGKKTAYELRQARREYELEMDGGGWAPVEQLLSDLRKGPDICV